MPTDDEWLNLEQTVRRHESDLDSQRKDITNQNNTLALLVEAIECLHLYTVRGITHALAAQKAGNRLNEIIAILKSGETRDAPKPE